VFCTTHRRFGFSSGSPLLFLTSATSLPFASLDVDEDRRPPEPGRDQPQHDHATPRRYGRDACQRNPQIIPVENGSGGAKRPGHRRYGISQSKTFLTPATTTTCSTNNAARRSARVTLPML
jgi:hypothetical protein